MARLLRRRRLDAELIDSPALVPDELESSLEQVAAVNRWLGGERSVRKHLVHLRSRRLRLLDVGTGNGTMTRRLSAWARAGGGEWRCVGLDLYLEVLAIASAGAAADAALRLVRGDALRLPFRDESFDVSLCTLTLHHFTDEDAARLVSELARVSRKLVLVSDLERRPLAYLGAKALALTWWRRNRVTRSDGPLSVLRSFTGEELRAIGRRGGLAETTVRRHFPFRLILEGRP
jgi:SAM-dependent methyltransferase